MDIETAKQQLIDDAYVVRGRALHIRLPAWGQGWTARQINNVSSKPTMTLYNNGNFYGQVVLDREDLYADSWQVVEVAETKFRAECSENLKVDATIAPHKCIAMH